jgi:hypothetical protein
VKVEKRQIAKTDDILGLESVVESGQAAVQFINSQDVDGKELGKYIVHPALNVILAEAALVSAGVLWSPAMMSASCTSALSATHRGTMNAIR